MSIVEANSIYESVKSKKITFSGIENTPEATQESLKCKTFLGVACLFSTTSEWIIVRNFLEWHLTLDLPRSNPQESKFKNFLEQCVILK